MIDFKAFRKANNLTQQNIADYLGCDQSFVSQIESGFRPPPQDQIDKILANEDWDTSALLADTSDERNINVSGGNSGIIGNVRVSGNHNSNIGTVRNLRNEGNYEFSDEQTNGTGEATGVPYYDVDFIGGLDSLENDQTVSPTYYIHFPQYAKAESWVNVTGHSMEPLINHGDMIAMKRLEDWNTYLLYGEVYAIVTDEYRTIKYVRKSAKGDDYLRLIPANPDFDEQDIPKSVVRGVFQILGCAKRIF